MFHSPVRCVDGKDIIVEASWSCCFVGVQCFDVFFWDSLRETDMAVMVARRKKVWALTMMTCLHFLAMSQKSGSLYNQKLLLSGWSMVFLFIQISMDCRIFLKESPICYGNIDGFLSFFPWTNQLTHHMAMLWACRALISSDRHSSSSRCVWPRKTMGKRGKKQRKNSGWFPRILVVSNHFQLFLILSNHL